MAAPTLVSANVDLTGTILTTVWNNALTAHSTSVPTLTNSTRGTTSTGTYSSGDTSTDIVWTLDTMVVQRGDTVTLDLPADTCKVGASGNTQALANATSNNSTIGGGVDVGMMSQAYVANPAPVRWSFTRPPWMKG